VFATVFSTIEDDMTVAQSSSKKNRKPVLAIVAVVIIIVIGVFVYIEFGGNSGPSQVIASLDTIQWVKEIPGNTVTKDGNQVSVVTDDSMVSYQIEALPKLPAGTVTVRYRIQLTNGSIMVGILSADRQKWLANSEINTPGVNDKTMTVNLPSEGTLVIANNRPEKGQSSFEIEKMDFLK